MNKIYTRSGDNGYTGLLAEMRVPKYHPIPEAVGTIDEATASLGIARSICLGRQSEPILLEVQRDLYLLMAEIAATSENAVRFRQIDSKRVAWLETQINALGEVVPSPKDFILPGDSRAGAALALARTIVRRAERRVASLFHQGDVKNPDLLRYLNRLSSLCFMMELLENQVCDKDSPTLANE